MQIYEMTRKDKYLISFVISFTIFIFFFCIATIIFFISLQNMIQSLPIEDLGVSILFDFFILVIGIPLGIGLFIFLIIRFTYTMISIEVYLKENRIVLIQRGKLNITYEIPLNNIVKVKHFTPALFIGKSEMVVIAKSYYENGVLKSIKRRFSVASICSKTRKKEIVKILQENGAKI